MQERPELVLHVIDAKNLERSLVLTLQLLEADLPLILVLNVIDEAEALGLRIDPVMLRRKLGIPVVATVGVTGRGLDALREEVISYHGRERRKAAV
jgi:ferrous iron transport protein B